MTSAGHLLLARTDWLQGELFSLRQLIVDLLIELKVEMMQLRPPSPLIALSISLMNYLASYSETCDACQGST